VLLLPALPPPPSPPSLGSGLLACSSKEVSFARNPREQSGKLERSGGHASTDGGGHCSSSLRFSGKVARPIRSKSRKMMSPPLGSLYFLRHLRSCASSACSRSSESGKMSEVLSNLCLTAVLTDLRLTAVLTDAKKAIALIAKHLVLYDRYVLQAFLASSTSSKRPMNFVEIVEVWPCAPK